MSVVTLQFCTVGRGCAGGLGSTHYTTYQKPVQAIHTTEGLKKNFMLAYLISNTVF